MKTTLPKHFEFDGVYTKKKTKKKKNKPKKTKKKQKQRDNTKTRKKKKLYILVWYFKKIVIFYFPQLLSCDRGVIPSQSTYLYYDLPTIILGFNTNV